LLYSKLYYLEAMPNFDIVGNP